MPPPSDRLAACLAVFLVAWPATALASKNDPPSEASPRWAASIEALGVVGGRYMLAVERRLVPGWGLVLHPFGVVSESSGSPDLAPGLYHGSYTTSRVDTRAFGLDVELRHYFGASRGAAWFVAPGVEAQYFMTRRVTTHHEALSPDDRGYETTAARPVNSAWTYLGLSFDVGFQVVRSRLLLGASVGLHARKVVGPDGFSEKLDDYPLGWQISHGEIVRPRARVWIGVAFD